MPSTARPLPVGRRVGVDILLLTGCLPAAVPYHQKVGIPGFSRFTRAAPITNGNAFNNGYFCAKPYISPDANRSRNRALQLDPNINTAETMIVVANGHHFDDQAVISDLQRLDSGQSK